MTFHIETIGSAVTANSSRAQDFLAGITAQMHASAGGGPPFARSRSWPGW